MSDFEAILKTEYSAAFDEHRKKAIILLAVTVILTLFK